MQDRYTVLVNDMDRGMWIIRPVSSWKNKIKVVLILIIKNTHLRRLTIILAQLLQMIFRNNNAGYTTWLW